jgi:hypothetical protein
MKTTFNHIRRFPNIDKEITKERMPKPNVADPYPSSPTAPLCLIEPIAPLAHPLTPSCTPAKPNDTIIDDSRRLSNIAKEIPKRQ